MNPPLIFLVLDDDEDMRFLHRFELEQEFGECVIISCATVQEALARTSGTALTAALVDYSLPGDNGAMFTAQLRQRGITCPVVIVTGSSDPKVHDEAYRAGATRVLGGTKLGFAQFLRQEVAAAARPFRRSLVRPWTMPLSA